VNGTIGRLHCRYQVVGDQPAARRARARLDRLTGDQVPRVMAEALDRTLGADPAVYVLRQVETRLLWTSWDDPDEHLARRWGEHLARAILRSLAQPGQGGPDLVRFDDEADYAGRFLADLISGTAWNQWYYRPFQHLRAKGTAGAAAAVLAEQDTRLPAVLAVVHRHGALERLLAAVDDTTLERLWHGRADADADDDATAMRPLLLAALRLADRLGLWAGERPELERAWDAYRETDPPKVSWRDPQALTAAVVAVLRQLGRDGWLRRPPELGDERFGSELDLALHDLDWLDTAMLRTTLPRLLDRRDPDRASPTAPAQARLVAPAHADQPAEVRAGPAHADLPAEVRARPAHADQPSPGAAPYLAKPAHTTVPSADSAADLATPTWSGGRGPSAPAPRPPDDVVELPARPRDGGPTLRQRRLLADLAGLVGDRDGAGGLPRLGPGRVDTAASALLVQGALVAAAPGWGDDPAAKAMVQRLLAAAARLAGDPSSGEAARRLAAGDADGALRLLPAATRAAAAPAYRFLADMGREAVVVAVALAGLGPGAQDRAIWSGSAGVFLLLRAVMDARLASLVEATGYPPLASVLLAVGLRWAGPPGAQHGQVDPGLAVLAGLDCPVTLDGLRSTWAGTRPRDHRRWREALAARVGMERLPRAPAALRDGRLGLPAADAAIGSTATALLGTWSRWLRGFSSSSVPFLLDGFVRRPGEVLEEAGQVLVRLEPRPLDVVLKLAGYTDELDLRPLGRRGRLRFEVMAS
jgi:hypothetical protein